MMNELALSNLACLPLVKTMETFTNADILLAETLFTKVRVVSSRLHYNTMETIKTQRYDWSNLICQGLIVCSF